MSSIGRLKQSIGRLRLGRLKCRVLEDYNTKLKDLNKSWKDIQVGQWSYKKDQAKSEEDTQEVTRWIINKRNFSEADLGHL